MKGRDLTSSGSVNWKVLGRPTFVLNAAHKPGSIKRWPDLIMSAGVAEGANGEKDALMPERTTSSGRREWHPGLRLSALGAFGFAVACVAVATVVRLVLGLFIDNLVAFAPYYPAVLIASLVAGRASGAFALVLGGAMSWWAFMHPYFTVIPPTLDQTLNLGIYVFASVLTL